MELRSAEWRKSTRSSGGGNGDCVEVADLRDAVGVRDSKDAGGPVLTFDRAGWAAFVHGLRDPQPAG
ncbi:DUF397 domain-containing protein [Micromonospora sp. NBC_01796]|uniref:DUF397 domain-containing protein n=1 Tax=Micromonospora sp. NBC_01796 TaxID=2975987 RepID=UPI002DDC0D68|nr:DUF397 domain-containing protein [Micromonospora sp. NBC_01796]WSA86801.1 DUF397 domain-containing protein [Micromonospora sp. NBC_01796]